MEIKEVLINLLGNHQVSDAPEELGEYAQDESFVHSIRPRCIVRPENAEEIQKIINWANGTLTPLVPVSSGPPHFRGDTVPGTGGAVILDLRQMNKIVRIDPEHRIAMVEPGVTFGELIPAVKKAGLRLNLPLLPRASKSVVGSLLEREPVLMPKYHWDISDPLACTEVIYGTGDFFKTGSAAGPGNLEEQWKTGAAQNEAAGPIQADFLRLIQGAQGTMGIVTWATIRCEHAPNIEEPYLVGSSKPDKLLEFVHWLIRNRMADDCLLLNDTNLASILAKNWSREYQNIKNTLPPWALFFAMSGLRYFPEEQIQYLKADMATIAQSMMLEPSRAIGRASAFELLKVFHGAAEEPYWKMRAKGSCHDIFFITNYDKVSDLIGVMNNIAVKFDYPAAEMGIYIQPIVQGVNYHCEFNLFFDPSNPGEKERMAQLSEAAFSNLSCQGAFFSRPYYPWTERAYRGDTETTIALRKIKKIFDPNNILNPGKLCF
jgi:hypothetical protein